jgi:ferritin
LDKLKLIGADKAGLYLLDKELAGLAGQAEKE